MNQATYQQRADHLRTNRAALERLADTLTAIATNASRRKDTTTQHRALDGIETLTELAQTLAAQMKQLHDELQQHHTQKDKTQ
jgi:methyl-accepting chemotaxis protein